MTAQATIILTNGKPKLVKAISGALAGIRVISIATEPPQESIAGPIWCFVDLDISGIAVCQRLRESLVTMHSHISVVCNEDDIELRQRALRAGADDYMFGPLTAEGVIKRLHQYRAEESIIQASEKLHSGDIVLFLSAYQMRYQQKLVPLGASEFRLLAHFLQHPNELLTRTQLMRALGKEGDKIGEQAVKARIARLRRSLKSHNVPDPLRTVRSVGYVLDSLDECEGI